MTEVVTRSELRMQLEGQYRGILVVIPALCFQEQLLGAMLGLALCMRRSLLSERKRVVTVS